MPLRECFKCYSSVDDAVTAVPADSKPAAITGLSSEAIQTHCYLLISKDSQTVVRFVDG